MKEIVIFAGTTEGRELSEYLRDKGIRHTVCVATDYGELVLGAHPLVRIEKGRMNREEMVEFFKERDVLGVVDATHPYATEVTGNLKEAAERCDLPYLRLCRAIEGTGGTSDVRVVENHEACAKELEKIPGNILLTTGSKNLEVYTCQESVKKRLYVRVLPGTESIELCQEHGICGKQIIAMQGPFTQEMNEALIHQYKIACLVTKNSGEAGGYREKLAAADKENIPVLVVGNRTADEGKSFCEVCRELETWYGIENAGVSSFVENPMLCGKSVSTDKEAWEIVLAGIGMGDDGTMTAEVRAAIAKADILCGAERMIEKYSARVEKKPYYTAAQIIPYLHELQENGKRASVRNIVVLFSGDSGFYSGTKAMYQELLREIEAGRLRAKLRVLPGISSVSYLASALGESYQDAAIYSIHGKSNWEQQLLDTVTQNAKTYLLVSGREDVNRVGELLLHHDLGHCRVCVGYQLSYPEQTVKELSPEECGQVSGQGLYTLLIRNDKSSPRMLTHGLADESFLRAEVPMTKEEVREVSICKLHLHENAVVYDIGSGTGSIAVEMAGLSAGVQVYAIERKPQAVALIRENIQKFGTRNVQVIEGEAPVCMNELPTPTHAFIGGSGGNLKEILQILYQRNPHMRVVINAVSVETLAGIKEVLGSFPTEEEELLQIQVNRTKKVGSYHMMQAENAIWICAFTWKEE